MRRSYTIQQKREALMILELSSEADHPLATAAASAGVEKSVYGDGIRTEIRSWIKLYLNLLVKYILDFN